MPVDFNRTEASAAPASIAINAVLDAGARAEAEKTRNYLGASAVGHPCLRKVQFDWMCDPVHPARIRDIFARGHFFEQQTREHFERAGFRFAEKDRLEFETLDHKAINAKGWRSLERDGLAKSYPQYAVQVALYQFHLGIGAAPAVFTATCADTCERLHILVPFDAELVAATVQRVELIVNATRAGELLPRMTDDPNNWKCRLCGHRERCWRT